MALELTVEKMVYGGDGLARYADEAHAQEGRGKTVLLPFVLESEHVAASVTEQKRSFMRAFPEKVLSASPHRVEPACPYFTRCGGCHYQHAGYEHQLAIKSGVLRETLLRTAKIDWQGDIQVHASPPWNYRNRTRVKVQSDPFAIGYYRFGSHTLLGVEQCPISSPLINRALTAVWKLGRKGDLNPIAEIEFFANADDSSLLLGATVGQDEVNDAALEKVAQELCDAVPEIAGVVFFAAEPGGSVQPISAFGDQEFTYATRSASYRVGAGSFFQTNRFLIDELVQLMVADRKGKLALDLYAGVGLFTLPLAKNFAQVAAVESSPASFADLEHNSTKNVAAHRATTETFLEKLPKVFTQPDYVVADPPRAGLGERVAASLAKLGAPQLAYLSCDPATLARDLKILIAGGYRIAAIHLIDLFPQTFHIESAVFLSR